MRPSEIHRIRAVCAECSDLPSFASWVRRATLYVLVEVEKAQAADRAQRTLPK